MDQLLYWMARGLIALIQAFPLVGVARCGRMLGALFYWLDARHRRVALRNLERCFGGARSGAELRALAREHFRRLGENYLCAIKTTSMTWEELQPHLEVAGLENLPVRQAGAAPATGPNILFAIGHFGNFELYVRPKWLLPGYRFATTYRGLRQPSLNRLLLAMRQQSGVLFFERRTEADKLKAAMREGPILVGFLADQHGGDHGLRLPFFGEDCSTSPAPAVFALRYQCPLFTAVCYRTGLARWRIEVGLEIPTHEAGRPRSSEQIMRDINAAFEQAIRRDPANWFWVHNRWKPAPGRHPRAASANTAG